ncbi:MAG TPA: hypothetical protein DEP66_06020, partial [Acidimicrobiaceae bacterium]|nr:hypothetical protein [Acidimicrobiaceae bacterium]
MSWCNRCQRGFQTEPTATAVLCPVCGADAGRTALPAGDGSPAAAEPSSQWRRRSARTGPPWHFWLLVVAAAGYLGWRAVEVLAWVVRW